jgi:hypothetical protein
MEIKIITTCENSLVQDELRDDIQEFVGIIL